MGWFGKDDVPQTSPQETEPDEGSFTSRMSIAVVRRVVDSGIDGIGPLDSAQDIVEQALRKNPDPKQALDAIVRSHLKLAASGGFVTGVGGLITMPVALPGNVVGFYLLAARMAGATAHLRGYDIDAPATRTALMLTLLGADADDVLRKVGIVGGGTMSNVALSRVPQAAAMVLNKGIGFRVATRLGTRVVGRLGRAVPLAGGVIGAGLDTYLMRRLAAQVKEEFPQR